MANSRLGARPNSFICASKLARLTGSASASSSSSASSYVSGWKTLSARSASWPFCLYPKTRSIHSWIRRDTCSDSSAARCIRRNAVGEPFAHVGRTTSPSSAPSRVLHPSGRSRTFVKKSAGGVKNSGVSSLTSAVDVSTLSHDSAME